MFDVSLLESHNGSTTFSQEDYLENVVDISPDETSPIVFEDQSEKEAMEKKLKIKKRIQISLCKKSLNSDFAISGNWVNTHLSI